MSFSQQLISYQPALTRVRKKSVNTIAKYYFCKSRVYCVYFYKETAKHCYKMSDVKTQFPENTHIHVAALNYRMAKKVYFYLGTIYLKKKTLLNLNENKNCLWLKPKKIYSSQKAFMWICSEDEKSVTSEIHLWVTRALNREDQGLPRWPAWQNHTAIQISLPTHCFF